MRTENENSLPFINYEVFSQLSQYGEGSVRPKAHRWPYGVSGKQNKLYASISSFQKDKVLVLSDSMLRPVVQRDVQISLENILINCTPGGRFEHIRQEFLNICHSPFIHDVTDIIILCGTNDIAWEKLNLSLLHFTKLLNSIKYFLPNVKVHFSSILPRLDEYSKYVSLYNAAISLVCTQRSIAYIDISEHFTKKKYFAKYDQIHLSHKQGIPLLENLLRHHLAGISVLAVKRSTEQVKESRKEFNILKVKWPLENIKSNVKNNGYINDNVTKYKDALLKLPPLKESSAKHQIRKQAKPSRCKVKKKRTNEKKSKPSKKVKHKLVTSSSLDLYKQLIASQLIYKIDEDVAVVLRRCYVTNEKKNNTKDFKKKIIKKPKNNHHNLQGNKHSLTSCPDCPRNFKDDINFLNHFIKEHKLTMDIQRPPLLQNVTSKPKVADLKALVIAPVVGGGEIKLLEERGVGAEVDAAREDAKFTHMPLHLSTKIVTYSPLTSNVSITNAMSLKVFPPLNELRNILASLLSFKDKNVLSFVNHELGLFDEKQIRDLIKLHENNSISQEVKFENEWKLNIESNAYNHMYQSHSYLNDFFTILHKNSNCIYLESFSTKVSTLKKLIGERWMSGELLSLFFNLLNKAANRAVAFFAEINISLEASFEKAFKKGENFPNTIAIVFNVYSVKNNTYLATLSEPGNHFVTIIYSLLERTAYYCDTLGGSIPSNLFITIGRFLNNIVKTYELNEPLSVDKITTLHSCDNISKQCTNECHLNFPKQTCGNICGVASVVITAFAVIDINNFKRLCSNECLSKLSGINYLKNVSEHSNFLRCVLIKWMTQQDISLNDLFVFDQEKDNLREYETLRIISGKGFSFKFPYICSSLIETSTSTSILKTLQNQTLLLSKMKSIGTLTSQARKCCKRKKISLLKKAKKIYLKQDDITSVSQPKLFDIHKRILQKSLAIKKTKKNSFFETDFLLKLPHDFEKLLSEDQLNRLRVQYHNMENILKKANNFRKQKKMASEYSNCIKEMNSILSFKSVTKSKVKTTTKVPTLTTKVPLKATKVPNLKKEVPLQHVETGNGKVRRNFNRPCNEKAKSRNAKVNFFSGLKYKTSIQKNVNRFLLKEKVKNRTASKKIFFESLVHRSVIVLRSCNSRVRKCIENFCDEINNNSIDTALANPNSLTFLDVIGGTMNHQKSAEPYFWETAYKINPPQVIQVDELGVAMNMFELNENASILNVKSWNCSDLCYIRSNSIEVCLKFFKTLTEGNDLLKVNLFKSIDICERKSHMLKGHSILCQIEEDCYSRLKTIRQLSCHYSSLRLLLNRVYEICRILKLQKKIRKELYSGSYSRLQNTLNNLVPKVFPSTALASVGLNNNLVSIDESVIISNFSKEINEFDKNLIEFPIYSCVCCERLLYKTSVSALINIEHSNNEAWQQVLTVPVIRYAEDRAFEWYICHYCHKFLKKNQLPGRAVLNELFTDILPAELEALNVYEMFLIQKAKAFQMIVRLGTLSGNIPKSALVKAVRGRIVYLPLPYEENIKMFPSNVSEDRFLVVLVNGYPTKQKNIWQDLVDFKKVKKALNYLKLNNEIYDDLVIQESDDVLETSILEEPSNDKVHIPLLKTNSKTSLRKISKKEEEEITQQFTVHPLNAPKSKKDDLELYQVNKTTTAPLKSNDEKLDAKCFPDLFPTGKYGRFSRKRKIHISDAEYRKSRLNSKHPRYRRNQQYLFHLLHESEVKSLQSAIFHSLRLTKNLGQCNVSGILNRMNSGDREFGINFTSFGAGMRGTKEFWNKRGGEVRTMMQKFGAPTFFVTLSSAEFGWQEMRELLLINNADLPNVSRKTTGELCSLDPVTVSRHFHYRFRKFFNNVLLSKDNPPLGKVTNYFWRVEYQSRAAAHIHMVLWIEGAPVVGDNSETEVLDFIQKYITCSRPNQLTSPQLHSLVEKFQMHKCSKTCYRTIPNRKGGFTRKCRFKFPRPECHKAILNDPFSAIRHHVKKKSSKKLYNLIRKKDERYINDYNPTVLLMWKANIDIQYICDNATALARYITAYVTKSEKCQLDELIDSCEENETLSRRLWAIGMKALTHRECGANEAADRILGHNLYGKSASVKYVNVRKKEERTLNLKPYRQLCSINEENPNSNSIFMNSWIDDYYVNRHELLEDYSLYKFLENYDYLKLAEENLITIFKLKNNLGYIKKRTKPHILSHIKYDPCQDTTEDDYYRSMLLLFKCFRDEDDLLGTFFTFKEAFLNEIVTNKSLEDYHIKLHTDLQIENLRETQLNTDSQESNGEYIETEEAGLVAEEECPALKAMIELEELMNVGAENELTTLVNNLNSDQSRVYHSAIDHLTKYQEGDKNTPPLNMFLSGMGGTGKSYFIKTLVTWSLSYYQTFTTNIEGNPIAVAKAAPTGIAACNIGGVTIHKLFSLPVEHNKVPNYNQLSNQVLRPLQYTLQYLKLIIIDEGSMIPNITLAYIHLRLCTILKNDDLPFGGCNVIIFGDLLQLAPVRGEQIFKPISATTAKLRIGSIASFDLWKNFIYDEFLINMRQSNDKAYGELCARIRVGKIDSKDEEFLQSKKIDLKNDNKLDSIAQLYCKLKQENETLICMMPRVKQCQEVNLKLIQTTCENSIEVKAVDSIESHNLKKKQKEIAFKRLEKIKDKSDETAGLATSILVALNARVMVIRNLDIKEGIVNGRIGTIKKFIYEENMQTVKKIKVQFDGNQLFDIERVNAKFELGTQIYAYRNQFPITLAYAITIHKAQGKTFQSAIIDCSKNVFASGQAYVALSRLVSSKGLYLIDFDRESVVVNKEALKEYNRLRKKFRSDLPLYDIPQENRKRKFEVDISRLTEDVNLQPPNKVLKYDFIGLENPDAVSCYCNAALQLLYSAPEIINLIMTSRISCTFVNDVKQITSSYCSANDTTIDASPLRISLSNEGQRYMDFRLPQQQDSSEFLLGILDTLLQYQINVKDHIGFTEEIENQCETCLGKYRVGNLQETFLFAICLPQSVDKISFTDLLKSTPHEGFRCLICNSSATQRKTVHIVNPKKYLLLEIRRFRLNTKLHTQITNFNHKNITLDNTNYKVVSAIAHEGPDLASGHYVNYKKQEDGWLKISDANAIPQKRFIKNMKNLYVLLLEKV